MAIVTLPLLKTLPSSINSSHNYVIQFLQTVEMEQITGALMMCLSVDIIFEIIVFNGTTTAKYTTASISGLNAGVYQVTVTDSLGCRGWILQ